MIYLCKVTDSGEQKRISLPKAFIKDNGWDDVEYIMIDDRDTKNINIRRFVNGETKEREGRGRSS